MQYRHGSITIPRPKYIDSKAKTLSYRVTYSDQSIRFFSMNNNEVSEKSKLYGDLLMAWQTIQNKLKKAA